MTGGCFFFFSSLSLNAAAFVQACGQTLTGPPPPALHLLLLLKQLKGQLGQVTHPLANEEPDIPEPP